MHAGNCGYCRTRSPQCRGIALPLDIMARRWLAVMISVCSLIVTSQCAAQPASNLSVQPLGDQEAASLHLRVHGCVAPVSRISDAKKIGTIANASWVMLGTSRGPIEMPVLFRDKNDGHAEVRFSTSYDEIGGSLRGVLVQRSVGSACISPSGCMDFTAHLRIELIPTHGPARTLFDDLVKVTDHCASDSATRVFRTVTWWERLFRSTAGH